MYTLRGVRDVTFCLLNTFMVIVRMPLYSMASNYEYNANILLIVII